MGVRLRWDRLVAAGVGAALALALGAAATPAAASGDLSETAQKVAAARKQVDEATTDARRARRAAQEAQDTLNAARQAEADAEARSTESKQEQQRAAKTAKKATATEGDAAEVAAAARSEMVQIIRSAYIQGSGNVELAAFVDFATVGPPALNALASHDMAVERIETSIVDTVARTGGRAIEAADAAEQARDDFTTATDARVAARKSLVRSRSEVEDAAAAAKKAGRGDRAAAAALATAEKRFAAAQAQFRSQLQARGGSAGGVAKAPSVSPGNQAQLVWDILIAEGFSAEATAGILGNLQQESNIDPTTVQNGGPGRGLAQWSQGGRWDNGANSLLAFAGARGLDPWDAVTQTRFMLFEMEAGWGGFDIGRYKKMTDVLDATVYFHDEFEGSADSSSFIRTVRGGYAMHWYKTLAS